MLKKYKPIIAFDVTTDGVKSMEIWSKEWAEETKKKHTFKHYIKQGFSEEEALKMIWEKPSCPHCGSGNIYFRLLHRSYCCRRCGETWDKENGKK